MTWPTPEDHARLDEILRDANMWEAAAWDDVLWLLTIISSLTAENDRLKAATVDARGVRWSTHEPPERTAI